MEGLDDLHWLGDQGHLDAGLPQYRSGKIRLRWIVFDDDDAKCLLHAGLGDVADLFCHLLGIQRCHEEAVAACADCVYPQLQRRRVAHENQRDTDRNMAAQSHQFCRQWRHLRQQ